MAFAWPASMTPQHVSWGIMKSAAQFRSPMAGSIESIEFPGQFWRVSITLPFGKLSRPSEASAFFSRLAGGVERVLIPYWPRLQPAGTMRGSPVLALAAARGDLQLSLTVAMGAAADYVDPTYYSGDYLVAAGVPTLKAGDMIGVGNQVFQVFADCAAVTGTLVVPLVNRVRGVITAGTAVVWNAPTVSCCLPSLTAMATFSPGVQGGIAADFEEA